MRRRHLRNVLAWSLVLQIALPATPIRANPSDGSTLAGDRGITPSPAAGSGSVGTNAFTGAASYQVPIEALPGTGGMNPELALTYSSDNRSDSWVGYGWSLGFPAVSRSLKRGTPTYTGADALIFGGQELVETAPGSAEYRTRAESFQRISYVAGTDSWVVEQPDGTLLYLGLSDNARVKNAAGTTYSWLLSEREDTHGNVIQVTYDRQDPGIAYLSEIRYTLLRQPNGSLQSIDGDPARDRTIEFHLESRPDAPLQFSAGLRAELNHRLDYIDVVAGGALARRYDLAYTQSADSSRSLLTGVALYGSDATSGTATPLTTTFDYFSNEAAGTTGWALASSWNWPSGLEFVTSTLQDRGVRLGDVDGDGLPDLLRAFSSVTVSGNGTSVNYVPASNNGVYRNTGSGFEATALGSHPIPTFDDGTGVQVPFNFATDVNGNNYGWGLLATDLTGDGRVDLAAGQLVIPYQSTLQIARVDVPWFENTAQGFQASANNAYGDPLFSFSKGGSLGEFSLVFGTIGGTARFADFNGDGLADMIVRGIEEYTELTTSGTRDCWNYRLLSYVSYNQGGLAFDDSGRQAAAGSPTSRNCSNGQDQDEYYYSNELTTCTLSDLACWFDRQIHTYTTVPLSINANRWFLGAHWEYGNVDVDVNGDGLSDSLSGQDYGGGTVQRASLNDGAAASGGGGLFDEDAWAPPTPLWNVTGAFFATDLGVRFVDVNGDGRVDVVRDQAGGASNGVWLNDGDAEPAEGTPTPWVPTTDWQLPGLHIVDAAGKDMGLRFVDLDGDGMEDIVDGNASSPQVYLNTGSVPDLLIGVTTPFGGGTTLTYEPSTTHPSTSLPFVQQVVASITQVDESGTALGTTTYDYQGGAFDAPDREFRGFAQVTSTDDFGTTTQTLFHQDVAKAGLPSEREVRDVNGDLWRKETFEYEVDATAPYRQLQTAHEVQEWDGQGASPRVMRTETEYDGFGNPTRVVQRGAGTAFDRETQLFYPAETGGPYIVNRVARVQQCTAETTCQGSNLLAKTEYFWDQTGDPLGEPTEGNLRKAVRYSLEGEGDLATFYEYDGYGNRTAVVNPRNVRTEVAYDPTYHAFPATVTRAVGGALQRSSTTTYTGCSPLPAAAGLPVSVTDENGQQTTTCYDVRGRAIGRTAPDGGVTTVAYDDTPGAVTVTTTRTIDATRSRQTVQHLDGLGRPALVTADGPQGQTVETTIRYDALGRVEHRSDPFFSGGTAEETQLVYDPVGRVVETHQPGNRTTLTTYDRGTITVTDPNQNVRKSKLDAFGDVIQVWEYPDGASAASVTTLYAYDYAGRLQVVLPPGPKLGEPTPKPTIVTYDSLGRRRSLNDPDTGVTTFTYDGNGNLETETDARSIVVTHAYDDLDRPMQRYATPPDSRVTATFTYDEPAYSAYPVGRLTTVTDLSGTQHFGHDPMGRVVREEHQISGGKYVLGREFDFLGQTTRRTFPDEGDPKATLVYDYDARGFVTGVREVDGAPATASGRTLTYASDVKLDAFGRMVEIRTGDGVLTKTSYDPVTQDLASLTAVHGASLLQDFQYHFDPGGRIERIVDRRESTGHRSFVYDGVDRLTSATGPYGAGGVPAAVGYGYDSYGNLTAKEGISRTYGENGYGPHAVTTVGGEAVTYDAAGNVTGVGSSRSYTWDALGRLSVASDTQASSLNVYDYAGRRTLRVAAGKATSFVTDDFEWDGTKATVHVFVAGRRIASRSFAYSPPLVGAWLSPQPSLPALATRYDGSVELARLVLPPAARMRIRQRAARRTGERRDAVDGPLDLSPPAGRPHSDGSPVGREGSAS